LSCTIEKPSSKDLRHIEAGAQHRQIQGRRLDFVSARLHAQHMLGEGLDQHLLVLRAAAHQRAHDAGGLGVLQHHVDVGIADPALQGRAFELQPQHGHVLDMDDSRNTPGLRSTKCATLPSPHCSSRL
jgi:hypothetical protein